MKYDRKRITLSKPWRITKHDITNEYIILILLSSIPRSCKLIINIKTFHFVVRVLCKILQTFCFDMQI